MRKSEIRKQVSERAGLDLLIVDRCYSAFLSCVREAILNDEVVILTGLGRFRIEHKPERLMHDNLHDVDVKVPRRRYLRFKPVVSLFEELNGL
jgi:DNA-binding protein HU-beta